MNKKVGNKLSVNFENNGTMVWRNERLGNWMNGGANHYQTRASKSTKMRFYRYLLKNGGKLVADYDNGEQRWEIK